MSTKNGGPAFPRSDGGYSITQDGMSLRDWFAGQALPTVVSLIGVPEDGPDDLWNSAIAEHAYSLADAMLSRKSGGHQNG